MIPNAESDTKSSRQFLRKQQRLRPEHCSKDQDVGPFGGWETGQHLEFWQFQFFRLLFRQPL
jgi:hypothetical protein